VNNGGIMVMEKTPKKNKQKIQQNGMKKKKNKNETKKN
jgi:hypothetical protein